MSHHQFYLILAAIFFARILSEKAVIRTAILFTMAAVASFARIALNGGA